MKEKYKGIAVNIIGIIIIVAVYIILFYGVISCTKVTTTVDPAPSDTVCLQCTYIGISPVPPPVIEYDTCMVAAAAPAYILEMKHAFAFECKQN